MLRLSFHPVSSFGPLFQCVRYETQNVRVKSVFKGGLAFSTKEASALDIKHRMSVSNLFKEGLAFSTQEAVTRLTIV